MMMILVKIILNFLGIVTKSDFIKAYISKKYDCDFTPVSTIMKKKLISIKENTHRTEV
jgi:CBS domain-containing protein